MKIIIPENLNEVTLEQYQKFQDVLDNSEDENFISLKMIEIFCNIPLRQAAQIPFKEVHETCKLINDAFEKKRKFVNRFFIDDIEYGFIPNLETMSMGEYVDIDSYMGSIEDLHKLMAVLYRPITVKNRDLYDIKEYDTDDSRSHAMRKAPLSVVLEAQVFFYTLESELANSLNLYLAKEIAKATTQQNRTSAKNGDGIAQSMHSQEATH